MASSWGGQTTSRAEARWGRETMIPMRHGGLPEAPGSRGPCPAAPGPHPSPAAVRPPVHRAVPRAFERRPQSSARPRGRRQHYREARLQKRPPVGRECHAARAPAGHAPHRDPVACPVAQPRAGARHGRGQSSPLSAPYSPRPRLWLSNRPSPAVSGRRRSRPSRCGHRRSGTALLPAREVRPRSPAPEGDDAFRAGHAA